MFKTAQSDNDESIQEEVTQHVRSQNNEGEINTEHDENDPACEMLEPYSCIEYDNNIISESRGWGKS